MNTTFTKQQEHVMTEMKLIDGTASQTRAPCGPETARKPGRAREESA
jgi:hypothetical protein